MIKAFIASPNSNHLRALGLIASRNDVCVVGVAQTVAAACSALGSGLEPDIAILQLPEGGSVAEAVAALRAIRPQLRIVLLWDMADPVQIQEAVAGDVNGCVAHDRSVETLARVLSLVMLGQRVLLIDPASLAPHLAAPSPSRPEAAALTHREVEVIRRIALGHSSKVIGRDLGIAENTVKIHIRTLMRKTGLANRTCLALWALDQGLVTDAVLPPLQHTA